MLGPMSDEKPFRFRKSDGELKSTSEGDSRWDDVMAEVAMETLLLVAERDGPEKLARIAVMKALNRRSATAPAMPRRKPAKVFRIVR